MPSLGLPGATKARGPRSDKGRMRWTERDLAVLHWIGEQYGIHLGQLAVLLSRPATESSRIPGMLGKETVRKLVQRWKRAGLVESASLVLAQPSWVWLTRKGLEQMGLDYRYWEPKAQGLAHLAAVNQGPAVGRAAAARGVLALRAAAQSRTILHPQSPPGGTSPRC